MLSATNYILKQQRTRLLSLIFWCGRSGSVWSHRRKGPDLKPHQGWIKPFRVCVFPPTPRDINVSVSVRSPSVLALGHDPSVPRGAVLLPPSVTKQNRLSLKDNFLYGSKQSVPYVKRVLWQFRKDACLLACQLLGKEIIQFHLCTFSRDIGQGCVYPIGKKGNC